MGAESRYFWVNQGATYEQARQDGSIWAPAEDAAGNRQGHHRLVQGLKPGDLLVHYARRSIRAIGRVTGLPVPQKNPYASIEKDPAKRNADGFLVPVEYHQFADPLPFALIADRLAALQSRDFLNKDGRAKQGYLWPFSAEGWSLLRQQRLHEWPPWADAVSSRGTRPARPPEPQTFKEWTRSLDMVLSPQLVTAYVLALQTKGFVILTGLSGTGKTKLARALATRFRVRRTQPVQEKQTGIPIEVLPYMLEYHRISIPVALFSRLPVETQASGGEIMVEIDGVREQARLSLTRPGLLRLLLRQQLYERFARSVRLFDTIWMEPVEGTSGQLTGLRLNLPQSARREVELDNSDIIGVRPDWTDSHGLLGFLNPITERYQPTPFLRLLLKAADEADDARDEERQPAPFFAVLDEMNLARVEHYFAEYLSSMESNHVLKLHDSDRVESGEPGIVEEMPFRVPKTVEIPENFFVTGTVNVDETTHTFSPKVLDRAFVLELNEVDLAGWENDGARATGPFALKSMPDTLTLRPPGGVDAWRRFGAQNPRELRETLLAIHRALGVEGRHFGYRVAEEVASFVNLAAEQTDGSSEALWEALDWAVLAKVLPKLSGTKVELEELLKALEGVCALNLRRCTAKLKRMRSRLEQTGFCAFIE